MTSALNSSQALFTEGDGKWKRSILKRSLIISVCDITEHEAAFVFAYLVLVTDGHKAMTCIWTVPILTLNRPGERSCCWYGRRSFSINVLRIDKKVRTEARIFGGGASAGMAKAYITYFLTIAIS